MADPQHRLQELVIKLRERGFRLTPQRMAVLKILAVSKGHPSVEQIYEQVQADFPMTGISTVYKTVTLLKQMGEVLEIGFSDGSNRYDGNRPEPHPHLICIRCKAIDDLDVQGLEEFTQSVGQQTGYRIVRHRLDLYGICPSCQGITDRSDRHIA